MALCTFNIIITSVSAKTVEQTTPEIRQNIRRRLLNSELNAATAIPPHAAIAPVMVNTQPEEISDILQKSCRNFLPMTVCST